MTKLPPKFYMLIVSGGDGSASVKFFSTEEKMEEYKEEDSESFCDSDFVITDIESFIMSRMDQEPWNSSW